MKLEYEINKIYTSTCNYISKKISNKYLFNKLYRGLKAFPEY